VDFVEHAMQDAASFFADSLNSNQKPPRQTICKKMHGNRLTFRQYYIIMKKGNLNKMRIPVYKKEGGFLKWANI